MGMKEAIRQAACEKTQEMVYSGEMVLPPDYSERAAQEVERLRAGKRKGKTLKHWKSAGKTLYEHVFVFGDIILTDEDGWYTIFERPTGKMIWGKHHYGDDIYGLYQFVIHLSVNLIIKWAVKRARVYKMFAHRIPKCTEITHM